MPTCRRAHGYGPKSLQDIIDYNASHPVEGLKYQQGELLAAEAVDLTDPATADTYAADLDRRPGDLDKALIDSILEQRDAGRSQRRLRRHHGAERRRPRADRRRGRLSGADRAGGRRRRPRGRDPIGVIFVGGAFDEEALLAAGYAFEQGSPYKRRAPSVTNPSMFRCVPGSALFTAELCNPGDRLYPCNDHCNDR